MIRENLPNSLASASACPSTGAMTSRQAAALLALGPSSQHSCVPHASTAPQPAQQLDGVRPPAYTMHVLILDWTRG